MTKKIVLVKEEPTPPPPEPIKPPDKFTSRDEFEAFAFARMARLSSTPAVLHLGSRRLSADSCPASRLFPNARRIVGIDLTPGDGVNVLGDIHLLPEVLEEEDPFDIVYSDAVLEHLEYPRVAAVAINAVLLEGGYTFHITHQGFPLHEFPKDYWRFSTDALESLFSPAAGFRTEAASFSNPQRQVTWDGKVCPWTNLPVFVHSMILARKTGDPEPQLQAYFEYVGDRVRAGDSSGE